MAGWHDLSIELQQMVIQHYLNDVLANSVDQLYERRLVLSGLIRTLVEVDILDNISQVAHSFTRNACMGPLTSTLRALEVDIESGDALYRVYLADGPENYNAYQLGKEAVSVRLATNKAREKRSIVQYAMEAMQQREDYASLSGAEQLVVNKQREHCAANCALHRKHDHAAKQHAILIAAQVGMQKARPQMDEIAGAMKEASTAVEAAEKAALAASVAVETASRASITTSQAIMAASKATRASK